MTKLAEREQHAKQFVNRIRKENGQRALGKLKRGIPKHPGSCTLAVSLPVRYANRSKTIVYLDSHEFNDPEVCQFMKDFDAGKYPHLEIPKTEVKIKFPGDRKQTVIS